MPEDPLAFVLRKEARYKEEDHLRLRQAHEDHLRSYFALPSPEDAREIFRPRWLVERLLPIGYLVVLGGAPKAGKTSLANAIAFAVASGQPFANRPTRQAPVLWCAYEENEFERAFFVSRMPVHQDGSPIPFFTSRRKPHLDSEIALEALDFWISETKARLLVIDSLHGSITKGSLADNTTARRVMTCLKDIATERNLVVLVLHHLTKSETRGRDADRFADSAQILATASMHIHMRPREAPDGSRAIRLVCAGRGAFANCDITLLSSDPLDYREAPPEEVARWEYEAHSTSACKDAKRRGSETTAQAILRCLQTAPATARQIASRTGKHHGRVRNLLSQLKRRNLVEPVDPSASPVLYRLTAPLREREDRECPTDLPP